MLKETLISLEIDTELLRSVLAWKRRTEKNIFPESILLINVPLESCEKCQSLILMR